MELAKKFINRVLLLLVLVLLNFKIIEWKLCNLLDI